MEHWCALAEKAGAPTSAITHGANMGRGRYQQSPVWRLLVDDGDFPAWVEIAYCPWCGGCLKCLVEAEDVT